jgi:hypothetical protein
MIFGDAHAKRVTIKFEIYHENANLSAPNLSVKGDENLVNAGKMDLAYYP